MKLILTFIPAFWSHGALKYPMSRQYYCTQYGWGGGNDELCQSIYNQGLYSLVTDWSGVSQGAAAGFYPNNYPEDNPAEYHINVMGGENVPICGANRGMYDGARQTKVNWLSNPTPIQSGDTSFAYTVTAAHKTAPLGSNQGYVDFYITENSRENAQDSDLTFADLELKPFCTWRPEIVETPIQRNMGVDQIIDCTIPKKSGLHTIFTIWQRSDSSEAFYSCSDVVFEENEATTAQVETSTGVSTTESAETTTAQTTVTTCSQTTTVESTTESTTATPTTTESVSTTTLSPGTYPQYVEGTNYSANFKVTNVERCFECKPHPYTGWCAGAAWAYAPGTGTYWTDAWKEFTC